MTELLRVSSMISPALYSRRDNEEDNAGGEKINQGRRTPINATSRVRWVHFAAPLHKISRQWKMEEPAGFTWTTRTASLRERIRKRRGAGTPQNQRSVKWLMHDLGEKGFWVWKNQIGPQS